MVIDYSNRFVIIIIILFLTLFNIYLINQSKDSLLLKKVMTMIDSLSSPEFDNLFIKLKKEAEIVNNEDIERERLQLQVYNNYLKGNTDSLIYYSEILKSKYFEKDSMTDYYQIWSYVISHYTLTGKMYKAITIIVSMHNKQSTWGKLE